MEYFNEMEVVFDSRSENEGFARVAVAAFMTQMDPVLEEVADVKTAGRKSAWKSWQDLDDDRVRTGGCQQSELNGKWIE